MTMGLVRVQRITPILGPGEDLDTINRRSIELFLDELRKLAAHGKTRLGLWEWTQESVLTATSESIYGPQNPFRDPETQKAWRIFEASFLNLASSPLPSWFSPRVLRAREACAAAMIKHMEKDGHKSASGLVRARHDHHRYVVPFYLLKPVFRKNAALSHLVEFLAALFTLS
ncbi:hypothetical protein F4823DRAFT_361451 [Ustulina deusta]|nr:hypothetical protein F4823DRAFT_361451 [Ustulina deusta]